MLPMDGPMERNLASGDVWSLADRKSTRLNSSHGYISYAAFCFLKIRRPPKSTLFPYPTLFRSVPVEAKDVANGRADGEEPGLGRRVVSGRSEEHTSELQSRLHLVCRLLFFKDPPTTEIYPLPLPDALPICARRSEGCCQWTGRWRGTWPRATCGLWPSSQTPGHRRSPGPRCQTQPAKLLRPHRRGQRRRKA